MDSITLFVIESITFLFTTYTPIAICGYKTVTDLKSFPRVRVGMYNSSRGVAYIYLYLLHVDFDINGINI